MSGYITVEFTSPDAANKAKPITDEVKDAFVRAAAKWSETIVSAPKPAVELDGPIRRYCPLDGIYAFDRRPVENLLVIAEIVDIDGSSKTLGHASICVLERETKLPAVGYIQLDAVDVNKMVEEKSFERLERVIMHEIGHCLGIGVLWGSKFKGLTDAVSEGNVVYTGKHGVSQYNALRSGNEAESVPVESSGGGGTAGAHWRNSVFGNELMTGFIGGDTQPLSQLTLGSLQDIGYTVDLSKAEKYTIPAAGDVDTSGDDFTGDVPPESEDTITRVPGIFPNQPVNNLLGQIAIGILLSVILLVALGLVYTKVASRRRKQQSEKGVELKDREAGLNENSSESTTNNTDNPFRDPSARSRTASDLSKEYYVGANPFAMEGGNKVART